MRQQGVRPVVDAASLSVVGLVEVVGHLPRIYGEFRKLVRAAAEEQPDLAILTDSPDFHLRVAKHLKRLGIPTIYLIAPQVWAWRQGRTRQMSRDLARLLCIFPFEKEFFEARGVPADYLGHPLTRVVKPSMGREVFFRKHGLDESRPLVTLLPGSRIGEVSRHLPLLAEAGENLRRSHGVSLALAAPVGFTERAGITFFKERIGTAAIQVIEGETWDAISHADVALAASGTVTVEAAILGTPMVTFYRVTAISWLLGKFLVRVPFYSMVNLIAGRKIVPELMQDEATGVNLAAAAAVLLNDDQMRQVQRKELATVASKLSSSQDPIERAATIVAEFLDKEKGNGA
jgi:lipid-A-disaccharide synthase